LGFERWQQRVGPRVRGWFEALGELEALCALAALEHDNPSWIFPTVEEGRASYRAEGLGHPLLPPSSCVINDVEVGPSGRFLLVTGSNMSGKSTLLRSIGINAVLAQAGGAVLARSLIMPPMVLGTSFRVQDSIEAGVSFFMAELKRLKEVVDLAGQSHAEGERRLLYLLDEILQGTNVYERQIAVRRVILHLLREGALGAVSTHDLTLAEADSLAEAAVPCHFTETYEPDAEGGPRMVFDYELREGVATTVNALKLLEMVGLGE
jgi:DNA mismatch repair ATPase MutS